MMNCVYELYLKKEPGKNLQNHEKEINILLMKYFL